MDRVLAQSDLHFAAKRVLFCRKTENILPQNGLHFAAKWKKKVDIKYL